ncbi:MAG: sulfurtransferase TusA family protein [Nocardioides sp.]
MSEEVVVDCRGMLCPAPIIALARTYISVPVGAVVAVAADDTAAGVDIPAWCRLTGAEFVDVSLGADGVPTYRVRKPN